MSVLMIICLKVLWYLALEIASRVTRLPTSVFGGVAEHGSGVFGDSPGRAGISQRECTAQFSTFLCYRRGSKGKCMVFLRRLGVPLRGLLGPWFALG